MLYHWSRYSQPGLIYFDDNDDEADGGQIVYMTFAVSYVSNDIGQRTQLIENCAYYLSTYVRDDSAPVLSDVRPHAGATVPPDASVSFTLSDEDTGIDVSSIWLSVNGATVATVVSHIDGEHLLSVTYAPPGGFASGNRYDLEIEACDFAGNCLTDDSYWFQTSDGSARHPAILAGGFMHSQLLGPGATLHVVAMAQAFGDGNAIERVELMFDGTPLGAYLNDDGLSGDTHAADGIYSTVFQIPFDMPTGEYMLQISATDALAQTSDPWPELHVAP